MSHFVEGSSTTRAAERWRTATTAHAIRYRVNQAAQRTSPGEDDAMTVPAAHVAMPIDHSLLFESETL